VALLVMIFRKMLKNKWLELSLLLGLTISVALVSSMPVYTNAILERLLVKNLEAQQAATGEYPGKYMAMALSADDYKPEERGRLFQETDAFMKDAGDNRFPVPNLASFVGRKTVDYNMAPADAGKAAKNALGSVLALSGMEDHIRLIDGRLPAKEETDGVWEALVTDAFLAAHNVVVGDEVVFDDPDLERKIRMKLVGVFDRKDDQDVYWAIPLNVYDSSFFVSFDLFEREITQGRQMNLKSGFWYFALDYSKLRLDTVSSFLSANQDVQNYFKRFGYKDIKAESLKTIDAYGDKEKRLRLMLWSLYVPVMMMLGFYLFMVANLITGRQKAEIAVLRSRGAGRLQIMTGYALEGVLLGIIALAAGPWLGLALTKFLGASNGFLEFVNRTALDVRLNGQAFQYAVVTVVVSLILTMIPAFLATRVSIVGQKQKLSRANKYTVWHKFGIDIVLIAVSLYGLQSFRRRMDDLLALGLDSFDFQVDPLLFLIPALFILGMGLFILRIYPWVIRFLYWCGRKIWPPAMYSTLLQVGRSSSQYQFIMVFLIITMATGLFSASAARTITRNMEEQILYKNGADIALKVFWENDAPPPSDPAQPASTDAKATAKVQYSEPPFMPFTQLPGVETAAKVFLKTDAYVTASSVSENAQLMGIDTDDFAKATWLRDDLLDHPYFDYLNVMASDPSAVLISRSIAERFGLKAGDTVFAGWDGIEAAQFNVYGIVDYWPGWNPNPSPKSEGGAGGKPMLVVGHLSYIQDNLALEPYDVWLKLKPEATSREVYEGLANNNIPVLGLTDAKQQLINQKNDPFQLAINGVMTLGFLISILVSLLGFLLFWILSLSGRNLQFGILRAMGLSFRQLIGMLTVEQLLTSGAGILIGIVTGITTSRLFVPLFKMSFNPAEQVPPFQVTFDPRDQLQLYVIAGIMIAFGLLILGWMLSRVKIHRAVKLGED